MFSRFLNIVFIILLVSHTPLSAQENRGADSLLNLLEKVQEDTSKTILYAQLAREYMHINLDSALMFANQGLYLAKKIEFENGIGDMYIALGHVAVVQNKMFEALDYYLNAVKYFSLGKNKEKLAIAYLVSGNVQYTLSNYPEAMDFYQKGLVIADSLNMTVILPDFYNNLGELHSRFEDYDAAIENLNKGLEIRQDAKNLAGAAYILVNLSNIYTKINDVEKARAILEDAHQLYKQSDHNEGLFNVYNAYASLERSQKNYLDAIEYYKEGHAYLKKIGTEYLGPKSILNADYHSNIGVCYLRTRNFKLAEENLSEAYKIAESTGQIEYLKNSSQYLGELYEAINQPEKAIKYTKLFKVYSDSISKDENIKKLTQLQMQFAFDKKLKEKEIEELKYKETQKRKELLYLVIMGGVVLSLIVFVLLFNMQRLKRKNLALEKENLKGDLDYKNKELTTNVMYLLKKNEFILNMSDKLKKSKYNFKPENRVVIDEIIRELELSSREVNWEDFEVRFQEVHNKFYNTLNSRFPDLTPNELKLCAFLRLNMSTKEIAAITYQSYNSLSTARYRLRKKLGLDEQTNLITFLNQL